LEVFSRGREICAKRLVQLLLNGVSPLNMIQNRAEHVYIFICADYTGLIHITHGLYGDIPYN